VREIIAGGRPEEHFERLGIVAEKTWEGWHPWAKERWTSWELDDENYGLLLTDGTRPEADDAWSRTESWWRGCGGSNLGGGNGETVINGRRIHCWDRRDESERDEDEREGLDYFGTWPHVFAYLCDHIGASTERNVAACVADLAWMNGLSVGRLLARTVPEHEGATG